MNGRELCPDCGAPLDLHDDGCCDYAIAARLVERYGRPGKYSHGTTTGAFYVSTVALEVEGYWGQGDRYEVQVFDLALWEDPSLRKDPHGIWATKTWCWKGERFETLADALACHEAAVEDYRHRDAEPLPFRSIRQDIGSPDDAYALLETLPEDHEDPSRFDIGEGLYWFLTAYHGGQGSEAYSLLSRLDFSPGACQTEAGMSEGALEVYERLVACHIGDQPSMPDYRLEPRAVILDCVGYDRSEVQMFQFGAYGSTVLLYFAGSDDLCDGLEACAQWLKENDSGYLTDPEYPEFNADGSCGICGKDPSRDTCGHVEDAEEDLTYTESGWIPSWEWAADTVDTASATRYALERAEFGAMVPEFGGLLFWEVLGELYPVEYFTREQAALEQEMPASEVTLSSGIHVRLTMPGCLDSTEWACYSTWQEAYEALLELAD